MGLERCRPISAELPFLALVGAQWLDNGDWRVTDMTMVMVFVIALVISSHIE